jgi:hypothetical protein
MLPVYTELQGQGHRHCHALRVTAHPDRSLRG